MKAFLMYDRRDFDLQQPLPSNEQALVQDLELTTLFNAMTLGDKFLSAVTTKAVLSSLTDLETIRYRQDVLRDCLKNAAIVREIYQIPIEVSENKTKHWLGIFSRYPSGILDSSVDLLQMFVVQLAKLKNIANQHADKFESQGFCRFFAMVQKELDDEYFATIQGHLRTLKFRNGVLISAELGAGNEGRDYILRRPPAGKTGWVRRLFARKASGYGFYVDERDDAGTRALSELRNRGINLVANAVAQSADHIDSFFTMLRTEMAFYIGCLNLYEQLTQLGHPVSFPVPAAPDERKHSFEGLYDISLALTMKQKVVGNDVNADHRDAIIITGANQGGKSTFLRSIGVAQLMMQAGMFVPAASLSANICEGLFTHYKRKEDASMKSGKLDEELGRMSGIASHITTNSMVLFNESFAATNEREGSEIARQITTALLEKRVKVFYVSHLFDFAHSMYIQNKPNAIFLRAERKAGGGRTYKLFEGEPLQTSYGEDVYRTVFDAHPG